MPSLPRFQLKSKPGEVHSLEQGETVVQSRCCQLGGENDAALERTEIEIVKAELTCNACLGMEWADDPGAEEQWLEAHGHSKKLAWREDSPSPQISRRETY